MCIRDRLLTFGAIFAASILVAAGIVPPRGSAAIVAGSAKPSAAAGSLAASAAPSAGGPAGSPAASAAPGALVSLQLTASGIAYDKSTLEAPANTPFQIVFANNDAGIPHNVSIHKDSATGQEVFKGDIFNGTETGTYAFVCSVHPNMTGTLTVK